MRRRIKFNIIGKPFYEQVFASAIGLSIDIYFDAAEPYAADAPSPAVSDSITVKSQDRQQKRRYGGGIPLHGDGCAVSYFSGRPASSEKPRGFSPTLSVLLILGSCTLSA